MSLYQILVMVHIFSAILGLGPGFVMIYVVSQAQTMTELKHAFFIRNRIHIFVMVGGSLLLITGLVMGILRTYLFTQGWFIISLFLYLIALAAGPLLLRPKAEPVKEILQAHEGEDIPVAYYESVKELFFYERLTNIIFLVIIALMILKPF